MHVTPKVQNGSNAQPTLQCGLCQGPLKPDGVHGLTFGDATRFIAVHSGCAVAQEWRSEEPATAEKLAGHPSLGGILRRYPDALRPMLEQANLKHLAALEPKTKDELAQKIERIALIALRSQSSKTKVDSINYLAPSTVKSSSFVGTLNTLITDYHERVALPTGRTAPLPMEMNKKVRNLNEVVNALADYPNELELWDMLAENLAAGEHITVDLTGNEILGGKLDANVRAYLNQGRTLITDVLNGDQFVPMPDQRALNLYTINFEKAIAVRNILINSNLGSDYMLSSSPTSSDRSLG